MYQKHGKCSHGSAGDWRRGLYQIINSNSHESAGEWRRGLYQIINSNDRCLLLAVNPQCVFVCKSLSRSSLFIFLTCLVCSFVHLFSHPSSLFICFLPVMSVPLVICFLTSVLCSPISSPVFSVPLPRHAPPCPSNLSWGNTDEDVSTQATNQPPNSHNVKLSVKKEKKKKKKKEEDSNKKKKKEEDRNKKKAYIEKEKKWTCEWLLLMSASCSTSLHERELNTNIKTKQTKKQTVRETKRRYTAMSRVVFFFS